MKDPNVFFQFIPQESIALTASMDDRELDQLQDAIDYARNCDIAKKLRAAGFFVETEVKRGDEIYYLRYPMVRCELPGASTEPGQFATRFECRRLLDTVKNLPTAEAFIRWSKKVEPLPDPDYTEADAQRDMSAEKKVLQDLYHRGKLDGEGLKLLSSSVSDYLTYVTPPGRPPLHGTPMIRIGMSVTEEQLDWLREHGQYNELLRRMIDQAIREE